ncbi:MAG: hypothetical protein CHACPFDD_00161 [Phycisphaerae bacterium]|nr:hypothetical protein [Phycisphaerae bacterium]
MKPVEPQHPSRRSLLKSTLAAGVASAAPRVLFGQDKAEAKQPRVGEGEHQYEVMHDWARVPEQFTLGNTHGVCEDSNGRIYIKHTVGGGSKSDDAVLVFDADGKFVGSWGKEYKGGAHGLHINTERGRQYLYLCDYVRGVVVKTDLRGETVWRLTAPMECGAYANPGEFKPTNVAVAANDDVYVADGYGKSWIHIYRQRDGKAEYVKSFGGPGKEAGQLSCPHGLMIDARGAKPRLLVADRSNRRLQYFTLEGVHDGFVTDELRSPCHFHEHQGVLLIPDLEARVTLFDRDNKLIAHLGDGENFALRDKPREKFIPGKFIAPHSAIFDHAGNIFVVEWVEVGRITKLRRV